jgi:hypothetical protein
MYHLVGKRFSQYRGASDHPVWFCRAYSITASSHRAERPTINSTGFLAFAPTVVLSNCCATRLPMNINGLRVVGAEAL